MAISKIETDSLASDLVAPTATALTTASGSAPSYSARAWVNFNGTGTVAIRASGNVSSITDSGVGFYTVNFTTAMPDVNYSTVATCQHQNGVTKQTAVSGENFSSSVSAVGLFTFVTGGSDFDPATVNVAVFR